MKIPRQLFLWLVIVCPPFLEGQQVDTVLVKEGQTATFLACPATKTTAESASAPLKIRADAAPGRDGLYAGQEFQRKTLDNYDDAEKITSSLRPHPYIDLGGSVMPGGYATLAGYGRAGFSIEHDRVVADAFAGYDNGRKVNDNDQPNPNGHDRFFRGAAYWRLTALSRPNWFVGGGYRWGQLATTNYTKGGSKPEIGVGLDYYWDRLGSRSNDCPNCWWSMRLVMNWVMAGNDWQNGSHGPEFTLIMPRPVEKRHLFMTTNFGIYRFFTTVTEPDNVPLTREQHADRHTTSTMSVGAMWRFW